MVVMAIRKFMDRGVLGSWYLTPDLRCAHCNTHTGITSVMVNLFFVLLKETTL